MKEMRDYIAAMIAEKYSNLKARAEQIGVREAIEEDCTALSLNNADVLLARFIDGMDGFDEEMAHTVANVDLVQNRLAELAAQHKMDDEQRYKFLSTMLTYTEQAGVERLISVLSGENDSVLRALLHMSRVMPCDSNEIGVEEELMDNIIQKVTGGKAITRRNLDSIDEETGDELMRCYASWYAIRVALGIAEADSMGDELITFVAKQVRAGQTEAKLLSDAETGKITGEQAAQGLKSVSEVIMVATSLFISSAAGVYTSMSVINLARLIFGVNGISMSIGVLTGLPSGIKVTGEVMKLCGVVGEWLEKHALEPAAEKTAVAADGVIHWFDDTLTPAVVQTFNGAADACKNAGDGVMKGVDRVVSGVRQGAEAIWNNAQPALDKAGDFVVDWMERTSDDLYTSLSRLLRAFNFANDGDI